MFYICEQNGDKYGVKDIIDGTVEYYTEPELRKINETIKVFGVRKKTCAVIDLSEYQTLDWGTHRFFSFVDKIKNAIFIGVESVEEPYKAYYLFSDDCYLDESRGMIPYEPVNKNGNLEWIFDGGRENKCAGVCIWLSYRYEGEQIGTDMVCEVYVEIHKDGKLVLVDSEGWGFNETGDEYVYDEENDCIGIRSH